MSSLVLGIDAQSGQAAENTSLRSAGYYALIPSRRNESSNSKTRRELKISNPLILAAGESIRAKDVFVWRAISCDDQRVFQARPFEEFPIPCKFRHRLPAVLRAVQDAIGAPEEQGVRQLRVRTLLKNVVRAQSHIESFALAGNLQPQRSVGVHSRCAHLVQMLGKTTEVSLLPDEFRFPSFLQ